VVSIIFERYKFGFFVEGREHFGWSGTIWLGRDRFGRVVPVLGGSGPFRDGSRDYFG